MILAKYYTRKRSLIFAYLWYESDKRDFRLFGQDLGTSLFLREGGDEMTTVWYEKKEFESITKSIQTAAEHNPELVLKVLSVYKEYWDKVLPYFDRSKKIESVEDFKRVFEDIIAWGVAFNVLYLVPDLNDVPGDFKTKALKLRAESDKYTESIDEIWLSYFRGLTDPHIVEFLTPDEGIKAAEQGLDDEELRSIKDRAHGYALLNGHLLTLQDLQRVMEEQGMQFESMEEQDVSEIKGSTAAKGLAKGEVKLIAKSSDIVAFKDGEILVAPMTQPSYLPALQKAAAIVTDEGGITCHAAIVSRELNIPCIIGTKIATKVLHDGDEVEVDADKGIVRIIKRR